MPSRPGRSWPARRPCGSRHRANRASAGRRFPRLHRPLENRGWGDGGGAPSRQTLGFGSRTPEPIRMKPFLAAALAFVCLGAAAQTAAPPTQRLRGTVESIDGSTIVLKERNGEAIRMTLADNFGVNEVVPI